MREYFPMAVIDNVMQRLQEAKVYTTLDLKNGFDVPFGISNSPAVFCRYISAVFHELIMDGTIVVYIDDIPSKNEQEGLEKLRRVLEIAASNGLQIRFNNE